jgi:Fe-S-cluster containining protein
VTDCNRCGQCCDPVDFPRHPLALLPLTSEVAAHDPATDEGWAWWASRGLTDRAKTIEVLQPGHPNQVTADFITKHWHVIAGSDDPAEPGHRRLRCDYFDKDTRLCTAHDKRPPVCSGFPWYGKEPTIEAGADLSPACSYNADVRTSLPIVAITGGTR